MEEGYANLSDIELFEGNFYVNANIRQRYNTEERKLLVSPFTRIQYGYYETEWTETLCFDEETGEKFWVKIGDF